MQTLVRPLFVLFAALLLLTGVAYPLLVTGIGQAVFPQQAAGSLLQRDGKTVGSALLGQNYSDPANFWGRLSATSPQPYNALASGGSNLGPLNPALLDAVRARVDALRAADPGNRAPVPVDLATASASGLDPHISVQAALYQVARVARARHLTQEQVLALVQQNTERPALDWLGETVVNVLKLNLALQAQAHG